MADNSKKTPLASSLNIFAAKKINDALQLTGKALPCSVVAVDGAIVTVNFEIMSGFTLPNVTVPVAESPYIRLPIQVGDLGVVFAADARLGGVSGLGAGVADLSTPGNLSALVFFHIGNKGWVSVDPDAVTLIGPNGVVLRDTGSGSIITLTPTSITLQHGSGNKVVISASGVAITGTLTINGSPYLAHEHSGVTTGSGVTGGVV